MARAINISALRSAEMHVEPWPWAHYEGAFLEPEKLAAVYPSAQMTGLASNGDTGSPGSLDAEARRTLIDVGAREPSDPSGLDQRWLEVANDLLSAEYRDALSELVGFGLGELKMRAVFHMFAEQYSCRPHLDDERELVAHLLYLDGGGDSGGRYQVLSSSDVKNLVAEVPPRPNQSMVQVRTERSWHAVTPPADGRKIGRKMLHITWESAS